jgi:hypothetical protein
MAEIKTVAIAEALRTHRLDPRVHSARLLSFVGVGDSDVYNPSRDFLFQGQHYLAGRVEPRLSELSKVVIFRKKTPVIYEATDVSLPHLQDPSIAFLGKKILLGGTEIYPDATGQITSWRTVFYEGADFSSLRKILLAPLKMKDVRVFKNQKSFDVFSRPQGGDAGPGKIGFAVASSLKEITPEFIEKAPLIDDLFGPKAWGGVNEVHRLKNGWLGLLGHVALMSEGEVRHYYGMVFAFNPKTRERTPYKIIAERQDFPAGPTKRNDLADVIFVGGLVRRPDGLAELYAGLSDARSALALIDDPFEEYEKK